MGTKNGCHEKKVSQYMYYCITISLFYASYHALKDEFYIRHSLQRQAAQLHHSTVAYAVSNKLNRTSHTMYFSQYRLVVILLMTPRSTQNT